MSDKEQILGTAELSVAAPFSSVQEAARVAYGWFESAERPVVPTEVFYRLREGRPDWVRDLVYAAHNDMLPDDWRFQCIMSACEYIAGSEGDDIEDAQNGFADGYVDVYTSSLLAWLSSNLRRLSYCDEALEEFGPAAGIAETITRGQYLEAVEVFGSVLASLEAQQ